MKIFKFDPRNNEDLLTIFYITFYNNYNMFYIFYIFLCPRL